MSDQYLLISDKAIEIPKIETDVENFLDCSSSEPYQIAEEYQTRKDSIKKYDAIFINIEAKVNGSNRSDLKAIELIFWLRLKYQYTGPIITYGFLSAAQILRLKPQYVGIHAPGNMHWRLGDELRRKEMPSEITQEQIQKEYRPYLLPLSVENNLRHENANRWAMWKMANYFKRVTKMEIDKRQLGLDELRTSIDFVVAQLLYQSEPAEGTGLNDKIRDVYSSLGEVEKRILLIDDMADAGWSYLFPKLMNCNENEFESLPISNGDEPSSIAKRAIERLTDSEQPINLILLDLRLKNEKGSFKIEDISGYKVLEELKDKRPDIPIIIVTASNKLQTNKALERMGVWGVWTKEGQDNNVNSLGLRQSLLSLMQMVKSGYEFFNCPAVNAIYATEHIVNTEKYKESLVQLNEVRLNKIEHNGREVTNKFQLFAFDCCIIDTNIWISGLKSCGKCSECRRSNKRYSDNCPSKNFPKDTYIKNQLVIHRLHEIFSHNGKELLIHNHVFSELREKARPIISKWEKERLDINLVATANSALDKIERGVAEIAEYDNRTYDKQAYADPHIVDFILMKALGLKDRSNRWLNPKKVILITNDNDLYTKVRNLRAQTVWDNDRNQWTSHSSLITVQKSFEIYNKLFK